MNGNQTTISPKPRAKSGPKPKPIIDGKKECLGCGIHRFISQFGTRTRNGVTIYRPRCRLCERIENKKCQDAFRARKRLAQGNE